MHTHHKHTMQQRPWGPGMGRKREEKRWIFNTKSWGGLSIPTVSGHVVPTAVGAQRCRTLLCSRSRTSGLQLTSSASALEGRDYVWLQSGLFFSWPASGGKWPTKRTFSALRWHHDRTVTQWCSIIEGSHDASSTPLLLPFVSPFSLDKVPPRLRWYFCGVTPRSWYMTESRKRPKIFMMFKPFGHLIRAKDDCDLTVW